MTARAVPALRGILSMLVLLLAGCAALPPPEAAPPVATPVATPVTPPAALPATVSRTDHAPEPVAQPPATVLPAEPSAVRAAPMKRLDARIDDERIDLWQRLRDGFALADVDDELVRKWEQFYASRPDYVARMTARGGRYLFHIIDELQRRDMPFELALLPFIESAFNPQARSRTSAAGMWQFMPDTGRSLELKQNVFRDDRRSVLASTRAALNYLQQLNERFADWQLALAAYNWGPGNVAKALAANERRGLPRAYASLNMPQETREYLPKLQAMKNIVRHPEAFGLNLPELGDHPYFLSVRIAQDIDVDIAARLAGLTVDEFQQLNPQLNMPVILAKGTPHVLLPYDNANRFLRALDAHEGATATWTAWQVPRTLKPAEAAKLVGMRESELREINQIPARMLVKAGSILVVPRAAHAADDVDVHIAEHAALSLTPEVRAKARAPNRHGKGARGAPRDSRGAAASRVGSRATSPAAAHGARTGRPPPAVSASKTARIRHSTPSAAGTPRPGLKTRKPREP